MMVMLLILLTSGFDYMDSPIDKKIPKGNILTSARISTRPGLEYPTHPAVFTQS
jgi:hypothetical protein